MNAASEVDLSVVVPTFNRSRRLGELLGYLGEQAIDRERSEVIVVDDGSSDDTPALLEHWARVELPGWLRPQRQSNQGQAAARQHGSRKARGRVLLFLDDDMRPASADFLAAHLARHAGAEERLVVLGAILPPEDDQRRPAFELYYERSLARLYASFQAGSARPAGENLFTANVSVTHALFAESGGFDVSYRHGEDVELGVRLAYVHGARVEFAREAAAHHHSATGSYRAFTERARLYARYFDRVADAHPDQPHLDVRGQLAQASAPARLTAAIGRRIPWSADLANRLLPPIAELLVRLRARRLAIEVCGVLYHLNFARALSDQARERT